MDYSIRLSNGQILRGFIKSPTDGMRAMIIMIHGIGEHINRYNHWADLFIKNKIGFTGVDLPGHGKSDGKRGHIKKSQLLDEMMDIMINECSKTFPGVPLFLYGHSLGGAFTLAYVLRRDPEITASIVTSPALCLAFAPSKAKIRLASIVKNVLPGLIQSTDLPVDHLSHDKEVVEAYINDPLVHGKISVSSFYTYIQAINYAFDHASELKIPLLLLHGSEDLICNPEGSRSFASKTKMAELKIWEGGYHELHNEPFKEQVFDNILRWINSKIE